MVVPVGLSGHDSEGKVVDCAVMSSEEVVAVVPLVVDLKIAEVVSLWDLLGVDPLGEIGGGLIWSGYWCWRGSWCGVILIWLWYWRWCGCWGHIFFFITTILKALVKFREFEGVKFATLISIKLGEHLSSAIVWAVGAVQFKDSLEFGKIEGKVTVKIEGEKKV